MPINYNKEPLTLSDLTKLSYDNFLLSKNPFPTIEVPGGIPLTTADRTEILDHFKQALSKTVFDNLSTTTVLIGDYGSGKSHLLRYFKYVVNSELLTSENKVLAVYVKSVGRSFRDLYQYFIDDLGRDFLIDLAREIIKLYFEKIGNDGIRGFVYDSDLKTKDDFSKIDIAKILGG